MTTRRNAEALAVWLAENQPEVFEGMLRAAKGKQIPRTPSNLAGISDVLSSLGTSFGAAVKSVGSFMASEQGLATLSSVGGLYLQTQAQRDALRLQVATVQAGYPPQPVQNAGVNTNSATPIYTPTGQPLTTQLANQLQPRSVFADYAPWIIGAVAAITFVFATRR